MKSTSDIIRATLNPHYSNTHDVDHNHILQPQMSSNYLPGMQQNENLQIMATTSTQETRISDQTQTISQQLLTIPTVKHDKKVMIWGCISSNGVGDLYQIQGILDAVRYKQILIHHLRPSIRRLFNNENECYFAQDNDPTT